MHITLMTRVPCAAAWFQGRPYVDGSLQDFVLWRNSEKLTCGGSAFIVDYSQVQCQLSRFRPSRLCGEVKCSACWLLH